MLLLFAKRCIILSAMSGISKRNTSGLRDRAAHLFANPVSPFALRSTSLSPSPLFHHLSVPPSLSPTSLAMHYLVLPLLQELHHNWPTLHVTGMHDLQITRKSPGEPEATPRSVVATSIVRDDDNLRARLLQWCSATFLVSNLLLLLSISSQNINKRSKKREIDI